MARHKSHVNYQLKFTYPREFPYSPDQLLSAEQSRELVKDTIDAYDFIGLTERFDESLVVLQLLLNLRVRDILYVVTNSNGSYDKVKLQADDKPKCYKLTPSFTSDGMKKYFQSKEWLNANSGDFLLYKAANASLDATIDNVIGRDKFNRALDEFLYLKNLIHQSCGKLDVAPCSSNGTMQTELSTKQCYIDDFGCGYPCLNALFANYTQARKEGNDNTLLE